MDSRKVCIQSMICPDFELIPGRSLLACGDWCVPLLQLFRGNDVGVGLLVAANSRSVVPSDSAIPNLSRLATWLVTWLESLDAGDDSVLAMTLLQAKL